MVDGYRVALGPVLDGIIGQGAKECQLYNRYLIFVREVIRLYRIFLRSLSLLVPMLWLSIDWFGLHSMIGQDFGCLCSSFVVGGLERRCEDAPTVWSPFRMRVASMYWILNVSLIHVWEGHAVPA